MGAGRGECRRASDGGLPVGANGGSARGHGLKRIHTDWLVREGHRSLFERRTPAAGSKSP